jgi:hypothetical protein
MRQSGSLQPVHGSSSGDEVTSRNRPGIGGGRRAMPFAVCTLTTWRVTHLLVEEDGPADLVVRLRRAAGSGALGQLMDCFYCASLWVALPLVVMITGERPPDVAARRGGTSRRALSLERVVTWLALSGAACLLERSTGSRSGVGGPGLLQQAPGTAGERWRGRAESAA